MADRDFQSLGSRVREWIAIDPDPETRAEADRLLEREAGDGADAEARLRRFLEDDRDQAIGVLARKRGEQVDAFRLLRSEPPSAQSQDA